MSQTPREIHARAPVRVDFAGGGTDCAPFCLEHPGVVINAGVELYAEASLSILPGEQSISIISEDFLIEAHAASLGELKLDGRLDLLKAIPLRMRPDFGFRLRVSSAVPPGSGLGGSGAVGVAVVAAFALAMEQTLSPVEIAQLANEIERVDLGYAGGDQDSYGPALGGVNLLRYAPDERVAPSKLNISPAMLDLIESRSFLVNTGEPHLSADIHDDIKTSYALPNSPTLDAMHKLAEVGNACADALVAGDLDAFAAALNANWTQHQRLHDSCNCPQLQQYYDLLAPDILGAKTCGAGGGGCIFVVAKEGAREEAIRKSNALGGVIFPFSIDHAGVVAIHVHPN